MYTKEQLQYTLETLEILKNENTEQDPTTYTVDEIVEQMIAYFKTCLLNVPQPKQISPLEAYDRAMKGIQ